MAQKSKYTEAESVRKTWHLWGIIYTVLFLGKKWTHLKQFKYKLKYLPYI